MKRTKKQWRSFRIALAGMLILCMMATGCALETQYAQPQPDQPQLAPVAEAEAAQRPETEAAKLIEAQDNGALAANAPAGGGQTRESEKENGGATSAQQEIGMEAAKKIALEDVKLSESDVVFTKAKEDRDDGRKEYDIEFVHERIEYEYEIDAITGAIRQFSKETVTNAARYGLDDSKFIGMDSAKERTLSAAGKAAGDVTFVKAELDYDDGRAEYDIEFICNNEEHSFEIDAQSGDVLEYEIEKIRS